MKNMKKILSFAICTALIIAVLTGCSAGGGQADGGSHAADEKEKKMQIVTTIFPEYDWVINVLGDNPGEAEVTMLLDKGVDLHSYQPSADDILNISTCDFFIYVGGESDEWVDDALQEVANNDMVVINLLDVLGDSVREEETVEGMQEDEHNHGHEEGEDHDEDEHEHEREEGETEYDEHVWLSLKNAKTLIQKISDSIQMIDQDNADVYKDNASAYIEKLDDLDKKYKEAAENASIHTLLFGDRFPFRYLIDDYGLGYYAAFPGCSAETEASFETVTFLSKKVDELSLPAVMTIDGTEHRIAETIVQNTKTKDQKILTMDSMQSTTSEDVKNGASYLSIMENNLSALKEALN